MLVPALLDTGADLSFVPEALASRLGLPMGDQVRVRAPGGHTRLAAVHAARIEIDGAVEILEVLALGDE